MIIGFQSCMFQKTIFMVLIIFMVWLAQRIQWSFVINVLKICIFITNISGEGGEKKEKKRGGEEGEKDQTPPHFGSGSSQIKHGLF